MISLTNMSQSNGCGNIRNYVSVRIWCGPLSQHPLHSVRHQPHPLIPSAQTMNQEETKNPEKDQTPNKLYCIALVYVQRAQG